MSDTNGKPCCVSKAIYTVAILGTFLIIGWLAWLMLDKKPDPIGAERSAERANAALEMKAASAESLNTIGWQDQGKQLVRLPITQAKQLTVQKWKNPAAARKELIARVDKASAPAPKAPETPSEFE
jgi:hypothetical protein